MAFVIPVFIPHQGCPHTCVFCNQHTITGLAGPAPVTPDGVRAVIEQWLARSPGRIAGGAQVAFYGGSFTGLPRSRQGELLDGVAPFLEAGRVREIRLSTRPDYIDGPTVDFLRQRGVTIVELGVQSMDQVVLDACGRGHTPGQAVEAVRLLRRGGMQVGLQLMVGLPRETTASFLRTVREAARLQPDFIRIYPVLVLRGSELADMLARGKYRPLSLGGGVVRAARMKEYFAARGIRVVRMGLQAGPELEKWLVAGPYHPAFGEMVNARIMLNRTRRILRDVREGEPVRLSISARDRSTFCGVRSANIARLRDLGLLDRFSLVTDADQPRHTVRVMNDSEPACIE
ncbi:MAG: radical SAM protein [Desulfobulbaceae bacterium]|jgi:histone acetyltransferase (RNA polymerase elongator complex component)|nr:radical SAM protein [Desulfobulbaceae bacterium]MDY0350196.1 radical SAM protein [Desulfobulbaceae bacterium]